MPLPLYELSSLLSVSSVSSVSPQHLRASTSETQHTPYPHVVCRAQQVTLSRGGRLVLSNVSFALNGGHWLHLAGPNGNGKSTLLRALADLLDPDDGHISIAVNNAPLPTTAWSAWIHVVTHTFGLYEALTARHHWQMWWSARSQFSQFQEHLVDNLVDKRHGTHLPHPILESLQEWMPHPDRSVEDMSQGQRQRLALTRLVLDPKPIWFLDEPCSHLDLAGRSLLTQCLKNHLKRGGCAVIASHQPLDNLQPSSRLVLEHSASLSSAHTHGHELSINHVNSINHLEHDAVHSIHSIHSVHSVKTSFRASLDSADSAAPAASVSSGSPSDSSDIPHASFPSTRAFLAILHAHMLSALRQPAPWIQPPAMLLLIGIIFSFVQPPLSSTIQQSQTLNDATLLQWLLGMVVVYWRMSHVVRDFLHDGIFERWILGVGITQCVASCLVWLLGEWVLLALPIGFVHLTSAVLSGHPFILAFTSAFAWSLGSIALVAWAIFAALVAESQGRHGMISVLLGLPTCIPVIVFGFGSVVGDDPQRFNALLLLGSVSLFALATTPWIIATVLRWIVRT